RIVRRVRVREVQVEEEACAPFASQEGAHLLEERRRLAEVARLGGEEALEALVEVAPRADDRVAAPCRGREARELQGLRQGVRLLEEEARALAQEPVLDRRQAGEDRGRR